MAKYKDWISSRGIKQITQWAEAGLTNKQIMKLIGIKHRTFYYWIERYPEFDKALRAGRRPKALDEEIEEGAGINPESMSTEEMIKYLYSSGEYSKHPKTPLEEEVKRLNIELGHKKRLLTLKIKKLEKEGNHTKAQVLRAFKALLELF